MTEVLAGVPLHSTVVAALRHAAATRPPGRPVDTAMVLAALVVADGGGGWDRVRLHTGLVDGAVGADRDADPGGEWNGTPVTATCARALGTAASIAERYGLLPVPPGVLAVGLVADPTTGAARVLGCGRVIGHRELVELVQEAVLGTDLDGLAAELSEPRSTQSESSTPAPPAPTVTAPQVASSHTRQVVAGLVLVGLAVASAVSMAMAPPTQRDAGLAPADVLVADAVLAPGLVPAAEQPPVRSEADLPHDPVRGYVCREVRRGFATTPDAPPLTLRVMHCSPYGWAALQQFWIVDQSAAAGLRSEPVPEIPFGAAISGRFDGRWLSQVYFRRGAYVVQATVTSADADTAGSLPELRRVAQAQWLATPGVPGPAIRPVRGVDLVQDISAVVAVLLLGLLATVQFVGTRRTRARNLRDEGGAEWRSALRTRSGTPLTSTTRTPSRTTPT